MHEKPPEHHHETCRCCSSDPQHHQDIDTEGCSNQHNHDEPSHISPENNQETETHDHSHHDSCTCCAGEITHHDDGTHADITRPLTTSSFFLTGLDCADCAAHLEKRIAILPGVKSARINFTAGTMTVEHTTPVHAIVKAVSQAGYSAQYRDNTKRPAQISRGWIDQRTMATIISGILLVTGFVIDHVGIMTELVIPLFAGASIIGGFHTAKIGLYGLRVLSFDMNVLMTVAVVGAAAIGEWSEAATVAVLFSVGNTLQAYTMDRTRRSIRALMDLAPSQATVRRDGVESILPVGQLLIGDLIIVRPGERIAMDGIVKTGHSSVNQAAITGESIPVEKIQGDQIYAGTVNGNGVLELEVTHLSSDSTLSKIIHLVEEAQAQKAPSQQFVDLFAKYYTPIVLLTAAAIMVIPWMLFAEEFAPWFYRGLVLLVISCPCALVISTPVSIASAIGSLSRNGVLIKGGAFLEGMGTVKAIAFDKTGTLTSGHPVVTDILPLGDMNEQDLLTLAASVEQWSEHPLAAAVTEKATGLSILSSTDFHAITGRGAQAMVGADTIYAGNIHLFEELGVDLRPVQDRVISLEDKGKTVMIIGSSTAISGIIAVADTLREQSYDAVRSLHKAGIQHITMLTGDNHRVASAMAQQLNLDSYHSDLLPQEKVDTIKKLAEDYGSVAMVGDGINDAPALATSNVGIAMGVAGSDTALETADIALMSDDLKRIASIIIKGRLTLAVIKQNIAFAILVKVIFVILALFGYVDLWLAVLADTGSSILVTLNGMRLMKNN
ncbi:heavy metal translocating P-type ATPase [Methanospirillum sp.]|uniref:heavy metal translocating P-type ATPase n=1 Tax=Methanospirillum sp. TaxID=45200 RepID=UPI002D802AE1|nr:heavy metal translocating P-type ATPase [Methanospirillum sp.]